MRVALSRTFRTIPYIEFWPKIFHFALLGRSSIPFALSMAENDTIQTVVKFAMARLQSQTSDVESNCPVNSLKPTAVCLNR